MFKFPALATGTGIQMTLNALPTTIQQTCNIGFTLFTMDGTQVGSQYLGPFTNTLTSSLEKSISVNISSAGWSFINGTDYYLSIQTLTLNTQGTHCSMKIPYGTDNSIPSKYALVYDQGPAGQPCGTTPWTTVTALDGGFIHMSIYGFPVTPSKTPSPSVSRAPKPSSYQSPSTSVSRSPSSSASRSPSPSASQTTSASASRSPSSSASRSPSSSASRSPSSSASQSPSVSATQIYKPSTPSYSPTPNAPPAYKTVDSVSTPPASQSSIAGSVIGGIVGIGLLSSVAIMYRKKTISKSRSPISSIIIPNPVHYNMV